MSLNVKKEKKREDMIVRDFCDLLRCEDEGFGTQEAKMQSHHTEPVRSGCGGKFKKKKSTHEEDQKDSAQVHRCSKNTGDKYMFCIYLYILYVCMMSTLCLHRRAAYGPRV